MNWSARLAHWRYRHLFLLGLVLVLVLFDILLVYHLKRSYTINLGLPGDEAFVSNFWADEADVNFRYRWTKADSDITFLGAGSAPPHDVTVWAQGPRLPDASPTITLSVGLDGELFIPSVALTPDLMPYGFTTLAPGYTFASHMPPYVVNLHATVFQAPGDSRTLGAKIDKATLRLQGDGLNLPPLDLVLWLLLFSAGIVALLTPLRWSVAVWLALIMVVALNIALTLVPHYLAAYLPPFAVVAALAGLLVWQRRRLPRWPFAADYVGSRPRLATWVMLAAMLVFAGVSLWALPQVVSIGHADYAENANVARNFVQGRGLTVDYVAQFYQDYPGITHPAETWPLLQPLLIAPFFAIFGPTTWAAKLPNLFILLALAWGVFALASRLWDARAGLFAGLLTLVHPYFFNTVLYPINDLAFTAIFFALVWLVWCALYPSPEGKTLRTIYHALLIGALSALLIWSKPSGATLLVGLALWAGMVWWRNYRREHTAIPWRSLAALAGAFVLVLLPLAVRNLLAFGKPYFSTESLDAWILRFWPYHDWEDIYKVYVGAADYPHPRWIVGGKFGYQNLIDAILINFRWVWEKGVMGGIKSSEFVIGPVQLLGAFLGFVVLSRRVASLFLMVFLSIGIYALFVLLYWHFEGRYFQVAIPWLYMLLAWGVAWVWDRVRTLLPFKENALLAWSVPVLAMLVFLWPSLAEVKDYLTFDTRPTSFTVAMDWLSQNSTPSDVVMTRDPWELNWHSGRKAVMIPSEDLDTIKKIAQQYGVTMLQLGGPADGIEVNACPSDSGSHFPTGSRPALGKLYCGYELPGFDKVYQNGDLTIYRLTSAP